jgi:hypothetical protein
MKRCTKCGANKSYESFNKDRGKKDGLYVHCRDCVKALSKYKSDLRKLRRDWYRKENPQFAKTDPYVYKIINMTTHEVYYGSSETKGRWSKHKSVMRTKLGQGYNRRLYTHMREHGIDSFEFKKMCICNTKEEAGYIEGYLIDKFGTLNTHTRKKK